MKRGERIHWTSEQGRTVTLTRTDSGQTWTVETRSTCGQTDTFHVFENEALAGQCASLARSVIIDLETLDSQV